MKFSFHQQVSYVKSFLRIVGLVMLLGNLISGGLLLLIVAEIVGILEEINENK
jgi:hypothetical protein